MTPTLRPAVQNRGIKVTSVACGVAGVLGLVLALYKAGLSALVSAGYLTAAQATILSNLANAL